MCVFPGWRMFLLLVLLCPLGRVVNGHSITSSLPAAFFTPGSGVDLVEGSVLQLFCTADSQDAVITWDRGGTVLTNDPPHIRIRSNSDASTVTSILTVDDFQTADNGAYQCTVGQTAMATTRTMTTFTPMKPGDILFMFRHPSTRETVRDPYLQPDNRSAVALEATIDPDGTSVSNILLRCVAAHANDTSQPLGTLVWTRNGQELTSRGRVTVSPLWFGTRYGADLHITDFMASDAGIYQCIATDNSSSDSDVATSPPFRLDTGDMLRLERVSPEVIPLTPPNKLVIEVKASGQYREIIWTKDGLPFGNSTQTGVFVVDSAKELPNFAEIFVRGFTTASDLGTYTVQLTEARQPDSLVFKVVPSPLELNGVRYTNNSGISITDIGEGSDSLICRSDNGCCRVTDNSNEDTLLGNWYYPNGTQVTDSGNLYQIKETHEVQLHHKNNSISPTGFYRCEVDNAIGNTQNIFVKLQIVMTVPSSPTNLASSSQSPTSITLSWEQPAGDVVDRYDIVYTYQGECSDYTQPENMTTVNDGAARVYILQGLEAFSDYTIRMVAVNSIGPSTPATDIFSTGTAVPSGGPKSVIMLSVTFSNIIIRWTRISCINRNSVITGYTVQYGQTGSTTTNVSVSGTSDSERMFPASGLIPHTNYTFQVAAVSSEGTGPFSNGTAVVTASPEEVGLFLNGQSYFNNSVIHISDIGEGSDALWCHTNNTLCCKRNVTDGVSNGGWYFPNGSQVLDGQDPSRNIFRNRGPSIVRLNHRNNAVSPTGLYRCEIPDASESHQSIYINLVAEGTIETMPQSVTTSIVSTMLPATAGSTMPPVTTGSTPPPATAGSTTPPATAGSTTPPVTTGSTPPPATAGSTMPPTTAGSTMPPVTTGSTPPPVTTGSTPPPATTGSTMPPTTAGSTMPPVTTGSTPPPATTGSTMPPTTGSPPVTMHMSMPPTHSTSPEDTQFPKTSSTTAAAVGTIVTLAVVAIIVILAVLIPWRLKYNGIIKFSSGVAVRKHTSHYSVAPLSHGNSSSLELELDPLPFGDKVDNEEYFEDCQSIRKNIAIPIPVAGFGKHVKRMHFDRDRQFEVEFESLAKRPQSSVTIATIPHNKLRNRFTNIFPYDYNRVVLQTLPKGQCTDYINASFVDGYSQERAYIAAQGPMDASLEDFWRMIWEYRLPTIVMLTRCFEGKKKCEKYWPTSTETKGVGNSLSVRMTSCLSFAEYDIRNLTLSHSSSTHGAQLKVTQFHYTIWPDHGVPANALSLLHFIKRVRRAHPATHPSPLLVHCSAGVGRTGSFVVLDVMLQRMAEKKNFNIYDTVTKLRTQRVYMVQSLSQYVFVHDAIDELITCGETNIAAENIRVAVNNLSKVTVGGLTGFQLEFELLQQISLKVQNSVDYTVAAKPANDHKNRYPDKIPNDYNRVFLQNPNSDYINASVVHGSKRCGAYIATQGPLKETVNDFWRMVWEYESKCIVMLCSLKENGKEFSHLYWPREKGTTESYGQLQVTLISEEQTRSFAIRTFAITEDRQEHLTIAAQAGGSGTAVVMQFHLASWPQGGVLPTTIVLELVEQVNKVQMSSGNKAITVMCNDGVGRSGAFMTIHTQLERLKTEGVVDIFQSLKSARIQRAGLVDTVEQYTFCYEALADYLNEFELYANFKEVV